MQKSYEVKLAISINKRTCILSHGKTSSTCTDSRHAQDKLTPAMRRINCLQTRPPPLKKKLHGDLLALKRTAAFMPATDVDV